MFRRFLMTFAAAAVLLCCSIQAMADKVTTKDGTVYEGTITQEGDNYLYIKYKVGSLEQTKFLLKDEVVKIERDSTPAPAAPKPEDKKTDKSASAAPMTGATRVVILNFGAPRSWQGAIGDEVGVHINAQSFRDTVPMLKKDNVKVVVIRINSGGGLGSEVGRFHDVFEHDFKSNFRTVGWVESAISAAAMSPYVLEEFYFLPEGNLGACTGWYGSLQNVEGIQLEMMLVQMEKASALGKRSPYIMRAMQIQEPLSASIDDKTGEVTWFQDETSGPYVLNTRDHIFTFNANDAVKFKFAKGIAATKEELARAMGLQEVEWAGQDATDYIDNNMRACDKAEKSFDNAFEKYYVAIGLAVQTQDEKKRGEQVGVARKWLHEMRRLVEANPNFKFLHADPATGRPLDNDWFRDQESLLRKLMERK